jgi:hypothetical protein
MPVDIFSFICLYWFCTSDQRHTASCALAQCLGLTALVERLKGRELQVSTRRPLLSLSNSPTRRQSIKLNQQFTGGIDRARRPARRGLMCFLKWPQPHRRHGKPDILNVYRLQVHPLR